MAQPTEQQIEAAAKDVAVALRWPLEDTVHDMHASKIVRYAVEQRARVLELEEALKGIIERYAELEDRECTKHDFYCCIDAARAVLKPKEQTVSRKDKAVE